jgi:hypothetical protein
MWWCVVRYRPFDMAFCLHLQATRVYSIHGGRRLLQNVGTWQTMNSVPFSVSPTTSALSHKKPCNLKEMFLQLSLSSGDLMIKGNVFIAVFTFCRLDEKGNVFTTVFIFWKLDEKRKCFYKCLYLLYTYEKRKCFYNCLYILEIGQKRLMYLQLSLSTGYGTKRVNTCTALWTAPLSVILNTCAALWTAPLSVILNTCTQRQRPLGFTWLDVM